MTPEEFKAGLQAIGLHQAGFARMTEMSPTTVSRWVKGIQPVPKWAEVLVAVLKNNRASLKLVSALCEAANSVGLAEAMNARLAASGIRSADLPETRPQADGIPPRSAAP